MVNYKLKTTNKNRLSIYFYSLKWLLLFIIFKEPLNYILLIDTQTNLIIKFLIYNNNCKNMIWKNGNYFVIIKLRGSLFLILIKLNSVWKSNNICKVDD